jgi:hypothetical protein
MQETVIGADWIRTVVKPPPGSTSMSPVKLVISDRAHLRLVGLVRIKR